jgi:hypothetical protein
MSGARLREPAWPDVITWFETIDAIVRGLGHSLNNRALALGATVESLDPRRPLGDAITTGLTRETERLSEQLRQFRTLPFAATAEPMPLLIRDVMASAIQLHRTHASLGQIPVYLEGASDAPPVLAPESSLLHATLVMLTALKGYAAPSGVVRIRYAGTADQLVVQFDAQRSATDAPPEGPGGTQLISPTALGAALLSGALLETEQEIGPDGARVVWIMPSLKEMRRRHREARSA